MKHISPYLRLVHSPIRVIGITRGITDRTETWHVTRRKISRGTSWCRRHVYRECGESSLLFTSIDEDKTSGSATECSATHQRADLRLQPCTWNQTHVGSKLLQMAVDTTMPGLGPTVGILKTVVVGKVAPSFTTEHPEVIYPSVYDLFVLDTYIPIVSLYRLDNTLPSAFSAFIRNVKDSLSKLQSLYYPLAGKWVVAEDLNIRKLLCNDEGAVFVEATVDDEMDKYFDFAHDFNPPNELFGELAIPGFCAEDAHKMPLNKEWPNLLVQVSGA